MKMTVKQTLEQFLLAWNSNAYLNMCTSDDMKNAIECMEKQVAKKPIDKSKNPKEWHVMACPCCGRLFWNSGEFVHYEPKWCGKCGQKIDWSREDD
jgi:hypothetical protein